MVHDAPPIAENFAADTAAAAALNVILTEKMRRRTGRLSSGSTYIRHRRQRRINCHQNHRSREHERHKAQVSFQAGRAAPQHVTVETGRAQTLKVPVKAAGDMPVIIQVSPLQGEVTTAKNLETLHINAFGSGSRCFSSPVRPVRENVCGAPPAV